MTSFPEFNKKRLQHLCNFMQHLCSFSPNEHHILLYFSSLHLRPKYPSTPVNQNIFTLSPPFIPSESEGLIGNFKSKTIVQWKRAGCREDECALLLLWQHFNKRVGEKWIGDMIKYEHCILICYPACAVITILPCLYLLLWHTQTETGVWFFF